MVDIAIKNSCQGNMKCSKKHHIFFLHREKYMVSSTIFYISLRGQQY